MFIAPLERYFFKTLPFGIVSAPENFQNRMATEGLEGVVCHIGISSMGTDEVLRKLEKELHTTWKSMSFQKM